MFNDGSVSYKKAGIFDLEKLREELQSAELVRLQSLERSCSRLESLGGEALLVAAEIPEGIRSAQGCIDLGRPCLILLVSQKVLAAASCSLQNEEERRLLQEAPGLEPIRTLRLLQKAWKLRIRDLDKALCMGAAAPQEAMV